MTSLKGFDGENMQKMTFKKMVTGLILGASLMFTGCGNTIDIINDKPTTQTTTTTSTGQTTTTTPTTCTTGTCPTSTTSTCTTGTCPTSTTSTCTTGTCPLTSSTRLAFSSIRDAELDTYYTSNSVTIQGVDGVVTAKTTEGTLVINGVDTDVSEYEVENGDVVAIKVRSSEEYSSAINVQVEVDEEVVYFSVTT